VPSVNAAYRYNLRDELLEATDTNTSQVLLDRETWGLDDGGNCPALRSRPASWLRFTPRVVVPLTRQGSGFPAPPPTSWNRNTGHLLR
jgi:hypothetical protein